MSSPKWMSWKVYHCSLFAMLSSPISLRAATSELLVAPPASSHECNMAVLHISISPPWLLLMLLRKGKSILSSRPRVSQSVTPRKLFFTARRCEESKRVMNKRTSLSKSCLT